MDKKMKKIDSEMLLRMGIIIFLCLTIFFEVMNWFSLYQNEAIVNSSGVWYILMWVYRVVMFAVVISGRGTANRWLLWGLFAYLLVADVFAFISHGKSLINVIEILVEYGGTEIFSVVRMSFFSGLIGVITQVLLLVSYIFLIFKYRSKKILITQVICWGLVIALNLMLFFMVKKEMLLYEQPSNIYAQFQSFLAKVTSILFLFWIMLKKECGEKADTTVIFEDKILGCQNCGKEAESGASFCKYCGEKLLVISEKCESENVEEIPRNGRT